MSGRLKRRSGSHVGAAITAARPDSGTAPFRPAQKRILHQRGRRVERGTFMWRRSLVGVGLVCRPRRRPSDRRLPPPATVGSHPLRPSWS